jgi:hypothetical protein
LVTTIPGPPETVTGAGETVKETDVPGAVLANAGVAIPVTRPTVTGIKS